LKQACLLAHTQSFYKENFIKLLFEIKVYKQKIKNKTNQTMNQRSEKKQ